MVEDGIMHLKIDSIMSQFEVQSAIDKLINTLVIAKDIATPNRKISSSGFKIRTPAVLEASKAKKEAFWEWKREGKPKTLDSASFQTMKQTTRKLRGVQRAVYKDEDTRELNKIAEACTSNSHIFHLLVKRRSQSTKSRELEYLIVDDVKHEANVLKAICIQRHNEMLSMRCLTDNC